MGQDNHGKAVGCVVIRGEQVLLVRHTYGSAKGKLLIPGGYVQVGEMPEDAAMREVLEETGVCAVPESVLCVRFQPDDWYVVFLMRYQSGEPWTDNNENSQAFFIGIDDVQNLEDVTDLSRLMIGSYREQGLSLNSYCAARATPDKYRLYGL